MQQNNEVLEFNSGRKNKKRIDQATGYVFVSCPDFSHDNGKYNYRKLGNGLPLSLSLASGKLLQKYKDKILEVYLSDHEACRPDVQKQLKLEKQELLSSINLSLKEIQKQFPNAKLLSQLYLYDDVTSYKQQVPNDYQLTRSIILWSEEGRSLYELEERYREKYAQMFIFMKKCHENNICPLFLYSKFNFNLVSNIRSLIPVPVIFLDVADPH